MPGYLYHHDRSDGPQNQFNVVKREWKIVEQLTAHPTFPFYKGECVEVDIPLSCMLSN